MRKKTNQLGPINANEIELTKILWTKVQRQQYSEVVNSIRKSKSNNLQRQLEIYIDIHGILRCHGRLENADFCENAKHPILLPNDHVYTDLLIERYHKESLHTGISQTLSLIQ